MLFALFFGFVTFSLIFAWLLIHRFRLAWLEEQVAGQGLSAAIAERRSEATAATPAEPGAGTGASPQPAPVAASEVTP